MESSATTTRGDVSPIRSRPDPRAARILARSLFRDMTQNIGLSSDQVLAVTSELIALVTEQLKESSSQTKGTA